MGKNKRNSMNDDSGKKIMHPADAIRRKAKKKKLNQNRDARHKHFEEKMLGRSPEDILLEINQLKADHLRKTKARIEISKVQIDRLTQMEMGYERLKEEVQEAHAKRSKEDKKSLHVDFEELKIHRKASIFYHPVNNPYGAPPSGRTILYRHPDGSVKREPPPLDAKVPDAEMGSSDGEGSESEEGSEDDDEIALPDFLPGCLPSAPFPSSGSSGSIGPSMPPLPPGAPPLPGGPPPLPGGQPPMPLGQPPLPMGQPPMPLGQPPMPFGQPPMPFGQPFGQPLLGQPPLPFGAFGAPMPGGDLSQAAFMASLAQSGFQFPVGPGLVPPGPPPKGPGLVPPGPPPKPKPASKGDGKSASSKGPQEKGKGKGKGMEESPAAQSPSGPPAKANTVTELPAGAKAPPPPPKKVAVAPAPAASRAALAFMPTTLRTKKPSQVAGGVLQATSSSLSMERRKTLISTEVPRVSERVNIDDAMADFMSELG